MQLSINATVKNKAKDLIFDGKVEDNSPGDGVIEYLVIDTEKEGKERYLFPIIWNDKVCKDALNKAKESGDADIQEVAKELIGLIGTKKEDSIDGKVARMDLIEIEYPEMPGVNPFLENKFTMTEEGFLRGRSIVTNIGVFPYMLEDGSVRYELRPPEEVQNFESLQSLKSKVLTNDHPSMPVNVETVDEVQVGFLGSDVFSDPYHIASEITITDKDTIEDVKKGKRALSCGYFADLEFSPGVWGGIHYDAIQRNIRYNHVAVVDKGRAGDAARIKMDSWSSPCLNMAVSQGIQKNQSFKEDTKMPMKNIKIDGVEYQAEAEVIKTLTQANEKVDSLELDLKQLKEDSTKLEGERDALKSKADQLETENKELKEKQLDEKVINDAVEKKLALQSAAKEVGVELKGDESDLDIKKLVINKVFPNMDLDGKEDIYIQAVFDTAIKQSEKNAEDKNREVVNSDNLNQDESEPNAAKARERMIADYKNRSKS